jgi:CxxC motif-containing protein (DUF1111 family)
LTIAEDRRVADVETVFDPVNGGFNRMFGTAATRFAVLPESGTPPEIVPERNSFVVRAIHADFKRHNMGAAFKELNFDGSFQEEFITEALWGVGTTPTYGHDGRSINLDEVILRHNSPGAEGDAMIAGQAFATTSETVRTWVRKYLNSLVLFGPEDTASNLVPKNEANPDYPQAGHGAIGLAPLFQIPGEGPE